MPRLALSLKSGERSRLEEGGQGAGGNRGAREGQGGRWLDHQLQHCPSRTFAYPAGRQSTNQTLALPCPVALGRRKREKGGARASVAVSAAPLSAESAAGGGRDVDFLAGAVCVVRWSAVAGEGGGGKRECVLVVVGYLRIRSRIVRPT